MELTPKKLKQANDFLKNPNTAIYKAILEISDKLESDDMNEKAVEKITEYKECLDKILEKVEEPKEEKDYTELLTQINEKLNEEQEIVVTLNVI